MACAATTPPAPRLAAYDDGMTSASAPRPRVFVARQIPDEGLSQVVAQTDADVWPAELPPSRAELLQRIAGVDGVLSMLTERVDDEFLDAAGPQLKVVSNYAVGFDNIDVPACTRRGVAVGNTAGVLTETTADAAFALLMAAARRIPEAYDYVRQDRWKTWGPMLLLGPDIHHATLGILGFGRIGREMAKRAHGFDMQVLYYDVQAASPADEQALNARHVSLDEVLAHSDFITLHVNLTDETHHLMNAARLGQMKRSAMLINASRGPVVDPRALYDALKNGVIAGAALDVTEPEPLPGDHPLLTLPNCLIVPHIASASYATRGKMASIAAENLFAGLTGTALPSWVNPDVRRP
jgi:lactate dehydrogenase-like 2-hydroxyacid dehydrogenase